MAKKLRKVYERFFWGFLHQYRQTPREYEYEVFFVKIPPEMY